MEPPQVVELWIKPHHPWSLFYLWIGSAANARVSPRSNRMCLINSAVLNSCLRMLAYIEIIGIFTPPTTTSYGNLFQNENKLNLTLYYVFSRSYKLSQRPCKEIISASNWHITTVIFVDFGDAWKFEMTGMAKIRLSTQLRPLQQLIKVLVFKVNSIRGLPVDCLGANLWLTAIRFQSFEPTQGYPTLR